MRLRELRAGLYWVAVIALTLLSCSSAPETKEPTSSLKSRIDAPVSQPDCETLQKLVATLVEEEAAKENTTTLAMAARVGTCDHLLAVAGPATFDQQTPLEGEHRFLTLSITKTFTAALVLLLVDEGKLELEDTVSKWHPDVVNAQSATIEHMLRHRSGIPDYGDLPAFQQAAIAGDPTRRWTLADRLAFIQGMPAQFPAGEGFAYSNTGYALLGDIVEKVSGEPLGKQMRTRLFETTGLGRTIYAAEGEHEPLVAMPLAMPGVPSLDVATKHTSWAGPVGAVASTCPDLALWGSALLREKSLLSEKTRKRMLTFTETTSDKARWGLGPVQKKLGPFVAIGHDGDVPGTTTEMWYVEEKDAVISVFATSPVPNRAQEVVIRLLEHLPAPGT